MSYGQYIIIKTLIVLRERPVYVFYGKLKNKRPNAKGMRVRNIRFLIDMVLLV